jgi:hypothetical protein
MAAPDTRYASFRNSQEESTTTKHSSRLIALLVVIGVLAVAAAAATSRPATGGTISAANQVRAAELAHLQAAVDADTTKDSQLLAPDFQLIDVLGAAETRADYLATIGGGIDFVTLKPVSPIKIRLYGNTAVARFQAAFEVVAGPDRLKHRGWTTDLFERPQGKWQLVWSQTTTVPNDPAPFIQSLKPHA